LPRKCRDVYEGRKTQRELMAFKPAKAEPTVATLSK